jgi:RNA polymerase sigma-70 factor (ECF subfamily)
LNAPADDRADFLRHFLKNEGDLRAFIGSLVRDWNVTEDVLQDVALTAWERFDDFDGNRSFGAWVRGIAVNKVLRRREQNARFPLPFSPETIAALSDAFDRSEPGLPSASSARGSSAGAIDPAEHLEPCLERLPEKSRRLLNMRYGESLDVRQIAERIAGTPEAVYKALLRVRRLVRACVEGRRAAEGRV